MKFSEMISKLEIETNEEMIDDEGNPRKDIEIHKDKLMCHPSMKKKLIEGIKIMAELEKEES